MRLCGEGVLDGPADAGEIPCNVRKYSGLAKFAAAVRFADLFLPLFAEDPLSRND